MKLLCWNVNGIRACAKKGLFEWVAQEAPDIFCLQETKANLNDLTDDFRKPLNYQATWATAEKKGYSGVATYSLEAPIETRVGFGKPEYDREGRTVTSVFQNFTLVNVYVPNGQPDHGRVPYKMEFLSDFLAYLEGLRKEQPNLIVCGDLNIAHKPIDLARPKENENSTGFLPVERAWLDTMLDHGYVDTFRALHPEPNQYTWWSYRSFAREKNIGWRLDYFMITPELKPTMTDVYHQNNVTGSDHCPIGLELAL